MDAGYFSNGFGQIKKKAGVFPAFIARHGDQPPAPAPAPLAPPDPAPPVPAPVLPAPPLVPVPAPPPVPVPVPLPVPDPSGPDGLSGLVGGASPLSPVAL
ncbi:hypothetical protein FA869_07650 [Halopseudomonas bauzanensis]|uniref:Uncharacterized protein n=1 Tax=Halopseudomonas bauzanensis TaxID=653930 RepID=A0A4V5NKM5_9GAMM|nr:hypothetical protein CF98_17415 [Halopseudomonas bauzanensis]TKA92257.1 hypothetical protein FA869_07650 [Halopseudomonas bauzanensis]